MTTQYFTWRKSSRSEANGACVEVAAAHDGMIGIRDSKAQDTGPLEFTRSEWAAFVRSIHT